MANPNIPRVAKKKNLKRMCTELIMLDRLGAINAGKGTGHPHSLIKNSVVPVRSPLHWADGTLITSRPTVTSPLPSPTGPTLLLGFRENLDWSYFTAMR